MTNFDLDKHIEEIKNGKYTEEYNQWATNLLHQVGRWHRITILKLNYMPSITLTNPTLKKLNDINQNP